MKGKVYLVGAGPGDPELLTLKALRLIREADVILHDELIGPEILNFASTKAHLRNVGKRCGRRSTSQEEINSLLVAFASFGLKRSSLERWRSDGLRSGWRRNRRIASAFHRR